MITPGSESGRTIRQKKPSRLQPSIAAASWSSFGMARRNGTRMITVIGSPNAICGRITPPISFISPMLRTMMYSGVIATVMGNISPAAYSE